MITDRSIYTIKSKGRIWKSCHSDENEAFEVEYSESFPGQPKVSVTNPNGQQCLLNTRVSGLKVKTVTC